MHVRQCGTDLQEQCGRIQAQRGKIPPAQLLQQLESELACIRQRHVELPPRSASLTYSVEALRSSQQEHALSSSHIRLCQEKIQRSQQQIVACTLDALEAMLEEVDPR